MKILQVIPNRFYILLVILVANLYLLKSDDKYKIGVSENPKDRVKQLQTGNPYDIELIKTESFDTKKYAHDLEERLHKQLSEFREEGEWFDIHSTEYLYVLKQFGFETAQSVFDSIQYGQGRLDTLETIISTQSDLIDDWFYMIKTLRNRQDDVEENFSEKIQQSKYIILFFGILLAIGVVI